MEQKRELTQLENQLYSRIHYIEQFLIQTKYLPRRVEPGAVFNLDIERNWSKFSGETLFINQRLLRDENYNEPIFCREALLLFAPKDLRDKWWIKILANTFPLSHKLKSYQHDSWEKLIRSINPEYNDLIDKCILICNSAGPEGIINALKQCLFQIMSKPVDILNSSLKKSYSKLNPKEFDLILSDVYFNSVKITDNALSIMELVLIQNSIKPKKLARFSSKHPSVMAKVINKLLAMKVLDHQFTVNYFALGLTQYVVLLNCTKEQSQYFRSLPSNPYLFSQKFNCLNTCIITHYYVAPKSDEFFKKLIEGSDDLVRKNKIINYYAFELTSSYRTFLFKYFDTKTKRQNINFNDIAIESDIFELDTNSVISKQEDIGNIVVPSGIIGTDIAEYDYLDLQIINQFLMGNTNRKIIQKNLRKDMNEVVRRTNRLLDEKIIYSQIWAILPDSTSEVTFYIEDELLQKKSKLTVRSLTDRLIHFCNYLPNVYIAYIRGSFNGILLRSYMPYSLALNMADFLNWYLPKDVNSQIVLGKSNFQKYSGTLCDHRWKDKNWLFYDKDFGF
ncbi:MAG: hypothetical protein FK733_10560 [Asgard group archaeon]|nr:hypothetical protein [Asgard group archaeon]